MPDLTNSYGLCLKLVKFENFVSIEKPVALQVSMSTHEEKVIPNPPNF